MITFLTIYILQSILGTLYWNHKLTIGIKFSSVLSLCVLPNLLLLFSVGAAKLNLLRDFKCKSEL